MHPVHGHQVANRFREFRVSATFLHFNRTRDLHTLELILPRTFVFEMHARLRLLALNSERNLDGNLIMVICAHLNIAHGAWRIVAKKKIYLPLCTHYSEADQF